MQDISGDRNNQTNFVESSVLAIYRSLMQSKDVHFLDPQGHLTVVRSSNGTIHL